jgi:hypothetical protein
MGGLPGTPAPTVLTIPSMGGVPTFLRTYKVPKGKLEALTKLMVRDDVPVIVRTLDDGIEVNATESQHAAFKAFVEMLSAEATNREYKVTEGQREALGELMSRDDVPTRIRVTETGIEVQGNGAEHVIFGAFVDLISGKKPETMGLQYPIDITTDRFASARDQLTKAAEELAAAQAKGEVEHVHAQARREFERAQDLARHAEQAAKVQEKAARKKVEAEMKKAAKTSKQGQLKAERADLETKIEALQSELETLEAKSDSLDDQADEIDERADEADEADSDAHREKAAALRSEAGVLRQKAGEIRQKTGEIERKISELEQLLDSMTR